MPRLKSLYCFVAKTKGVHHMLRRIYVLLFVIVFALGAAAIVNSHAEASDGWTRALALIEQKMGYTADQLEKNNLVYSDGVWAFSVTIIDHPADEDGLIVGEMDSNGKLLCLTGPEKISLEQQLLADLKSCFNRNDCYLLLAEVCQHWNERLADADEDTLADIWDKYLSVLSLGIRVPSDNAISYDAAYAAAWAQLIASEGWSEDMADMFRLAISAYYTLDDVPVFFFYFERHSYFEAEYSTDKAMNQYRQALDAAFSAVGQTPPLCIGILVNAQTGKLVEPAMMDYVPSQFHYLDFLIRTEEALNSMEVGE